MSIPTPGQIKIPMLKILANELVWQRMDIVKTLASHFNLTDADFSIGFKGQPSKRISESKFYKYCNRTIETLEQENSIAKVEIQDAGWQITPFGKQYLEDLLAQYETTNIDTTDITEIQKQAQNAVFELKDAIVRLLQQKPLTAGGLGPTDIARQLDIYEVAERWGTTQAINSLLYLLASEGKVSRNENTKSKWIAI